MAELGRDDTDDELHCFERAKLNNAEAVKLEEKCHGEDGKKKKNLLQPHLLTYVAYMYPHMSICSI